MLRRALGQQSLHENSKAFRKLFRGARTQQQQSDAVLLAPTPKSGANCSVDPTVRRH